MFPAMLIIISFVLFPLVLLSTITLRKAITSDLNDPELSNDLACLALESFHSGQISQAVEALELAVELDSMSERKKELLAEMKAVPEGGYYDNDSLLFFN